MSRPPAKTTRAAGQTARVSAPAAKPRRTTTGAAHAKKRVPKVGFVSLGCPKALVDSERIITRLRSEGYEIAPEYRAGGYAGLRPIADAAQRQWWTDPNDGVAARFLRDRRGARRLAQWHHEGSASTSSAIRHDQRRRCIRETGGERSAGTYFRQRLPVTGSECLLSNGVRVPSEPAGKNGTEVLFV